jgi:MFS family permease
MLLFFTNGLVFSSVLPRYPELKATHDLTNAGFGLAVAMFPLGAILAGLGAAPLLRRWGSRDVAVVTTVLTGAGVVVAGTAPAVGLLFAGLFLAGAMDAITDVAQNAAGLRVQRAYRRSILNAFHAVWCAGAVSGGLLGALAAGAQVPLGLHLALAAALSTVLAVVARRFLLPGRDEAAAPDAGTAAGAPAAAPGRTAAGDRATAGDDAVAAVRRGALRRTAVLAALVAIGTTGMLVEDAGASWSAIYLSGSLGATALVAGWGFIALQGMQFVGRVVGDRFVDRFGQRAVARTGGVLVAVAMGVALAVPTVPGTVVGFGLAGLGVSTLIPAAMHAADELPGLRPGTGLTVIGWLMRLGVLISPPVVGAVADATSLRAGLLVVPIAGVLVVLLAPVLVGRARSDEPEREAARSGA